MSFIPFGNLSYTSKGLMLAALSIPLTVKQVRWGWGWNRSVSVAYGQVTLIRDYISDYPVDLVRIKASVTLPMTQMSERRRRS